MASYKSDIVIFGAGIAGLWLHHRLRKAGYNSLLLETHGIGGIQSIASQGILHSGLKYAFAGKVNSLAQSISAMPDRWRACLAGEGEVDLRNTEIAAQSQLLMIPSGFMGGLVKLVTKKALGGQVREVARGDWPDAAIQSGFKGQIVYMDEPVLNVPSLMRVMAAPYKDSIRKVNMDDVRFDGNVIHIGANSITAQKVIFTAAGSNNAIAAKLGHDKGLQVQCRPLLMGMMRPAPFELYAHLVGSSDKPVATITTHKAADGTLVWYIGGSPAERSKDSDPQDVYKATKEAFTKYMPALDLTAMEWSVLPVDRIEGKSDTQNWLPDTPTVHRHGDYLYCWPTKLTFAPMLGDAVFDLIDQPSGEITDWSFLPEVGFSGAPWDA
jgi:glycerol-3-phosphate dehydrogenase